MIDFRPQNSGGFSDEDLARRLNDSAQQMDALLSALEARWPSLSSIEQKVEAVAATLEELDRKKVTPRTPRSRHSRDTYFPPI